MFSQEVRRYYPFAPAMGAKVKQNFIWNATTLKRTDSSSLIYMERIAIPACGNAPTIFYRNGLKTGKEALLLLYRRAEAIITRARCAGEWLTVIVMQSFFDYFVNQLTYEVPDQDLSYGMRTDAAIS